LGLHFTTNISPSQPAGEYVGSPKFAMRGDWIFELSKISPSGVFEWEVWVTGVKEVTFGLRHAQST
jgi:hypothetical protein